MQQTQSILPIGTVLNGRYTLESLLGKGGFGNVYLARDQDDSQQLFALAELLNPKEHERYRFTLDYVSPSPVPHQTLPQTQSVFTDLARNAPRLKPDTILPRGFTRSLAGRRLTWCAARRAGNSVNKSPWR